MAFNLDNLENIKLLLEEVIDQSEIANLKKHLQENRNFNQDKFEELISEIKKEIPSNSPRTKRRKFNNEANESTGQTR